LKRSGERLQPKHGAPQNLGGGHGKLEIGLSVTGVALDADSIGGGGFSPILIRQRLRQCVQRAFSRGDELRPAIRRGGGDVMSRSTADSNRVHRRGGLDIRLSARALRGCGWSRIQPIP